MMHNDKKRILMLGGNFLQISAIERAKELGYYVITADYLPDNPGHKYSDEYHNVSTTDKEGIYKLAKELKVDGILSYASDVSAPAAAYACEKLGLPTNPYESVCILTNKERFRHFLKDSGIYSPGGAMFTDFEAAREYVENADLPLIVKPTDSSGSKGVTRLCDRSALREAFDHAMSYSISKKVIIEKFVEKHGYQIDGDGFVYNGVIEFFGVMDQHNNIGKNPYAPIGLSTPSIQPAHVQDKARALIQKIFDALDMKFGAFNFEYIIDKNDDIMILEIGPRNGGNFIPDTIKYAYGIDMIEASIKACAGDDIGDSLKAKCERIASSYVVHSLKGGKFDSLSVDPDMEGRIIKQRLSVNRGDEVSEFHNGGDSIGAMVISFDSVEQMDRLMDEMWEHIRVNVL